MNRKLLVKKHGALVVKLGQKFQSQGCIGCCYRYKVGNTSYYDGIYVYQGKNSDGWHYWQINDGNTYVIEKQHQGFADYKWAVADSIGGAAYRYALRITPPGDCPNYLKWQTGQNGTTPVSITPA